MKKFYKILIIAFVALIGYLTISFVKFVFFKEVKVNEEFHVYKVNKCKKELNDEMLCRFDLIGDRNIVSIGLPERYVNFLKKQPILIKTYTEKNRLCLKKIKVLDFSETFITCSLVYTMPRNDR